MDAIVYNTHGTKTGTVSLPEHIFAVPWNPDLVHQVVTAMQANARVAIAHTKGQGDVRGGGRKPWRQKGTGRARHGSIRSPIWRGGGVTHGPTKERDFSQKINKKMRTKALYVVLSRKLQDGEMLFLDDVSFATPKTKDAVSMLSSIATVEGFSALARKRANAAVVALPAPDTATKKSFQNISHVTLEDVRNLNPVALLAHKFLIIARPEESLKVLVARGESRALDTNTKKQKVSKK